MNFKFLKAAFTGLVLCICGVANAGLITSGAGSAVSNVDAFANFESTLALSGSYSENGIDFLNTGNMCGYAGCTGHTGFFSGTTPFVGNYIYKSGDMTILATSGNIFTGLELILGTGYSAGSQTLNWSTFIGGTLVGSGNTSVNIPSIYGWSDMNGFDKLVFRSASDYTAYDSVKVQYKSTNVPEPSTLAIFALGMIGLASRRFKKQS